MSSIKPSKKIMPDLQIAVHHNVPKNHVELYLRTISHSGSSVWVGSPVVMSQLGPEDEGAMVAPTMIVPTDTIMVLMDELWGAGFRPSETNYKPPEPVPATAVEGELKATKFHLDDMRRIVDNLLEFKK